MPGTFGWRHWLVLVCGVVAFCGGLATCAVHATDWGQYGDVPNDIRAWFKSVQSPKGVPCCDIADGHRTTWKGDETGTYWVPIDGEWHPVPRDAIVLNSGNPTGEAVVWYTKYSGKTFIRCFVPGEGA